MRWLLVLCLTGCMGDDSAPELHIVMPPDAAIDSSAAPVDACAQEPSHGCCDLLPDTGAVATCASQGVPAGSCGVAVCFTADCSRVAVDFCAP